nr:copia protein [Tanacetum cinerariifolium]
MTIEESKDLTPLSLDELIGNLKICLEVGLEPDEWIKDSGCSKHMTGNRKLFSTYKAYNGGQICDNKCRVTFSEHDSEITKEGKLIGYSQNSKAYIILNKHTRKVKESLNATFDETPPPSKTSPLVDDDLDEDEAIKITEKKNIENDIVNETLEIDKKVNIKESRNHPLENFIGNLNQRTLRSQAQNQSNFFCFISTIEPKNVNEVLGDESWIVSMQEELNQFIANDVWELVPQPRNMTLIGTKWVFRNKLDENGVISRNKARLVAQVYNQQEGIDYDETYALVARLESIRILLAYACALDFKLFQMDVKSAFLNGFINEDVYVAQPSRFINFEKPDHDMCDEFAKIMHDEFEMSMIGELNFFLGLQIKQMKYVIFFNQSKYIKEMLKKFGLEDSKPMKTPMSSDTKLKKDEECESVDSTKYRGMIGTMHLGLWYPKGIGIETIIYADSDHAGDYVDRKSTSGICTFVGCCLTSWFSKKQTAIAISTTEIEYVSARKACQQALLFKHVVSVFLELATDNYLSFNHVMHPFAPHYERKTRSNHGKKRPRESKASSSSATQNHPSSSLLLDAMIDESYDDSSHPNSSSPSQQISSSSTIVSRVHQNPSHESHNWDTFLSETINLQTQQRDAHREGLRSIRQALKNMMGGKRRINECTLGRKSLKGADDLGELHKVEVHTEGQRSYRKITRLGGSSASYQFFIDLLKHLDRKDLNQLWALVNESLSNRKPTSDKEMELRDKEIFMHVEKDYPLRKGLAIVMICYNLQAENYSQMENDLILKIYKIANCLSQQEEVPTASEESSHCQKKRDATAKRITLLSKSQGITICLWILDSGCSKHMTGNRALLTNFVEKFLGTVRFGNNDFAVIAGYGYVVIGSMTINKVYYVEGLGHNLFSVGQFCDKGLEVAFRKSTCFVRNEDGLDLLTGDRSSNLYAIALNEVASNFSTCLLAKGFFFAILVVASTSLSFKLRHNQ